MNHSGTRLWVGLAVLIGVGLCGGIAPAHAVARARITVNGTHSSRRALKLAGRTIAGRVFVSVAGVKHVRSATYSVDGNAVGTASVGRNGLPPVALGTGKLKDGRRRAKAVVHTSTGRVVLRAPFRIANRVPAENLIATALKLHRIDYGKSLLDRMYSIWGDASLPRELRGTGARNDDASVDKAYFDASKAIRTGSLPDTEARALRPFLRRPADPSSVFRPPIPRRTSPFADASADVGCPSGVWYTDTSGKFRGWSNADAQDPAADVTRVLTLANTDLGAITPDMGNPLSDGNNASSCSLGNPDALIDVYLLNPSDYQPRSGQRLTDWANPPNAYAQPLAYGSTNKCSAFIVLNRKNLPADNDLKQALTHELYHLAQDRYNCDTETWFREASATWAQLHYDTGNPAAAAYDSMMFDGFQGIWGYQGLDPGCMECYPAYYAFLWPQFMTQEGASVAAAWKAMRGVSSAAGANATFDAAFSFRHLRDFALREAGNDPSVLSWHERGSSQPATRFETASTDPLPASFPNRAPSSLLVTPTKLGPTGTKVATVPVVLPGSLGSTYRRFSMPDTQDSRSVKIDLTKLPKTVDADVLVKVEGQGGYEHRRLGSKKLEYCRDDAGDDISKIVLVLTNHSLSGEKQGVAPDLKYRTADCGRETFPQTWSGTVDGTADLTDPSYTDWSEHWDFTYHVTFTRSAMSSDGASYDVTPGSTVTATVDGSGTAGGNPCTWHATDTLPVHTNGDELQIYKEYSSGLYRYGGSVLTGYMDVPYSCKYASHTEQESPPAVLFGTQTYPQNASSLEGTWDYNYQDRTIEHFHWSLAPGG